MKKIISVFLCAITAMLCLCSCSSDKTIAESNKTSAKNNTDASVEEASLSGKHHVEIVIEKFGTISAELDADQAPITVTNFINLAKSGFYDGLTFHRIVSNFVIQGGDPQGTGTGGSGKTIKGEFTSNGVNNTLKHSRGAIAMARSMDPDSASSQFYICQADVSSLDGSYAVFGYVTSGMEIVDKICAEVTNGDLVPSDEQPVIETIKVID